MQAFIRVVRHGIIGVTLLYTMILTVLSLLWMVPVQSPWWLAISNIFALLAFAPLLLLVPLALLLRSWAVRGSVALLLVLFIGLFGARLLPSPSLQPESGLALRVVTYNHLYSNQQIDAIIAAIRAQDADIVALQELSGAVAAAAQEQLAAEYPYQALSPAELDYGLGILSRYPIVTTHLADNYIGQHALLDVHGQPVTLINVHLSAPSFNIRRIEQFDSFPLIRDYNTSRRSHEMPGLLQEIDQISGPLIVAGDFNTSDRELPYRELAARMHDAYGETAVGFGFTFPNQIRVRNIPVPFPLVRIDYVWSRGGFAPRAARVECNSGGSDHCMLVADLQLTTLEATERGWSPW